MNTYSIESFIEFVNAQDPDRVINHYDWSTCAVGDYCVEYLEYIHNGLTGDRRLVPGVVEVRCMIRKDRPDFRNFILPSCDATGGECNTYGDMQDYFRNFPHAS